MSEEIIQAWVGQHDELSFDGRIIKHDGKRLGSFRNGRISLGPDDGGVKGEVVELDDEWLIVEGTQVVTVGQERHAKERARDHQYATYLHGSMVQWEGKFAVQPWMPRQPEIDGPLPE